MSGSFHYGACAWRYGPAGASDSRGRAIAEVTDVSVRTTPEPLDAGEAIGFVSVPDAGGTVLFSGTVRSPNQGEEVDHLFYEVWDERVTESLEGIAREALGRYGARRAYVAHRSGRVRVGEPSVVVAVSAPHRGEAFDACRFIIDTLKSTAPIWKQEITHEGSHWVGMPKENR